MVFEVAEGGGKAGALVEGMLIDAQKDGAVETDALAGLSLGELMIDTLYGGLTEFEKAGQSRGANAQVMLAIDLLAERLAAVAPGKHPGQLRDKRSSAIQTAKAPGMDNQPGHRAKATEMANLSKIRAFTVEASAPTAKAASRLALRFNVNFHALIIFKTT